MKTFRNILCLTLIAAIAGSAMADEKEKKGTGKKGARKQPTATRNLVGKLELDDAQKAKVAEIDKQFADKFAAVRKAMSSVLTDEQKKTQQTMGKAAKEAGKKPQETRKAIEAALELTDAQKAKRKEAQANVKKLNVEIIAALKNVLTSEQMAKLPGQRGGKGAKGEKGKKRKKKDAA